MRLQFSPHTDTTIHTTCKRGDIGSSTQGERRTMCERGSWVSSRTKMI